VLSVTLRDPFGSSTTIVDRTQDVEDLGLLFAEDDALEAIPKSASSLRVTSLRNLDPQLSWSIQSQDTTLVPKLRLQSISASLTYKYNRLKSFPSSITALFKFGSNPKDKLRVKGSIRPSIVDTKTGASTLGIHLSSEDENHMGWLLFTNSPRFNVLKEIRSSHRFELPFLSSMSSVTLRPAFEFTTSSPSCLLSGETRSGRTAAFLDLNYDNPTLRVEHALDHHNIISPQLSLHTARILYSWNLRLNSEGSSILTRVDPTSAIHVTWTDRTTRGGKWTTDFYVPLAGSGGALAADIKVRRQFSF